MKITLLLIEQTGCIYFLLRDQPNFSCLQKILITAQSYNNSRAHVIVEALIQNYLDQLPSFLRILALKIPTIKMSLITLKQKLVGISLKDGGVLHTPFKSELLLPHDGLEILPFLRFERDLTYEKLYMQKSVHYRKFLRSLTPPPL